MKRMLTFLLSLSLATLSFGQQKEVRGYKHTLSASDDKDISVLYKIDDGRCHLVITQNDETYSFDLPLDSLKPLSKALDEALEKLHLDDFDIDIDVSDFGPQIWYSQNTWLGVYLQPLSDQLRDYFKVRESGGVLISEVVEDSPADEAGLRAGDVIIRVDDEEIQQREDLVKYIRDKEPGDEVEVRIVRNGRKKTLSATLDSGFPKKDREPLLLKKRRHEDFPELPHFRMFKHRATDFDDEMNDLRNELDSLREDVERLKEELEKSKKP